MTDKNVLGELVALLGADIVKAPDATLLEKHTHDYCVHGRQDVGVQALVPVADLVRAEAGRFLAP